MLSAASRALAEAQFAPWAGLRPDGAAAQAIMARLNATDPAVFILDLSGVTATLLDKPAHYPQGQGLPNRARDYRKLLEDALRAHGGMDGTLRLVLSVHDLVAEPTLPLFAFQKKQGSRLVLLPDVDFMRHRFYAADRFADPIPFAEKHDRALFVGSTSGGGRLTAERVRALDAPRLRAAVRFRGSPRVDFWLPRIVQCADAAAEEAIRALDIAGRPVDWPEAFAWRYLISMDGNGATCSRVALALRSNGVLLKYDSPHVLHYFGLLRPWVHYIPIAEDADVTRAMDRCAAEPGLAESIAAAGQAFHAAHLERAALLDYTWHLLLAYRAWCGGR